MAPVPSLFCAKQGMSRKWASSSPICPSQPQPSQVGRSVSNSGSGSSVGMRGHCSAGLSPSGEHFPRVPQQEHGRPFCGRQLKVGSPSNRWRSCGSSLEECQPILSPTSGRSWDRWTASPRQALNCPSTYGSCFIGSLVCRASWEGMWGGTGLLVVASVFPANMACAKVSYPTWAVRLPRSCPGCQPLRDPGLGSCGALSGKSSLEGGVLPVGSSHLSSQAWPGPGRRECSRSREGRSDLSGPMPPSWPRA